ncbi:MULTISPECIES: hypothetical protein [Halomonadaceae]|uniref:hypothetical protein n=1 Tax=Halomonadaceae TaxID=28256 RepID=UPI0012F16709|nr:MULTISPECIES: hypothetical protein [Halomonas]CAD5258925.1 conserved hypothetical protein [Halomonas sp. 59]CAD5259157.1 conserved hypothetical protein [Halomonas sp. 113]CAD5273103.1 Hydroxymethylglutaryl-CoA reductase [Halomonas sp. I3]CAD5289526.1 conserved hypothetical protein [Halomonas sp. 156]VXB32862.1 conserved hypothetical protein [Halomonas titanicae]
MKYLTPLKLLIYSVMLFSFFMLESPVIMLANRIEPLLMGIPFLLVWNLFWWFVLTALFLVAYFTNWGSPTSTPESATKQH